MCVVKKGDIVQFVLMGEFENLIENYKQFCFYRSRADHTYKGSSAYLKASLYYKYPNRDIYRFNIVKKVDNDKRDIIKMFFDRREMAGRPYSELIKIT